MIHTPLISRLHLGSFLIRCLFESESPTFVEYTEYTEEEMRLEEVMVACAGLGSGFGGQGLSRFGTLPKFE